MQRLNRLGRRSGILAALAASVLFLGVGAGYVWSRSGPDKSASAEYRKGYAQGVKEADEQFAKGVVTVYSAGLPVWPIANVDGETGFPIQSLAGCIVNDEIIGRIQGHFDRIKELVAAGKSASNSYKTWIDDLNDLVRYHAKHMKLLQPVRLAAGGPSVVSPDGRFKVRYAPPPGARTPALMVAGADDKKPPVVISLGSAAESRELVWGPKGSPFCVVRSVFRGGVENFQSYDLTNGVNIIPTTRVVDEKQQPRIGPEDL